MRLSALLLALLLTGCHAAPSMPLRAVHQTEGLNFASQAQAPTRAVTLLSAGSDGRQAVLEYAVLRGDTPHRRRLAIDFNGEPQNPDAWQIREATLNGATLERGALGEADRQMLKQELAELAARLSPAEADAPPAADRRVQALPGSLAAPTHHNRVTFHVSAESSRQALIEAVRQAERSFYVETFIWNDDAAGRELAEALIARKREAERQGRPFEVKILLDAIGLRFGGGGRAIIDRMRQSGLEVRLFSPYFFSGGRVAPITHHKLYIADGSQVLTGGRNIGDEYLRSTYELSGGERVLGWHDLLYSVAGEETGRLREAFFKNWERAGGKRPANPAPVVPDPLGKVAMETVTTDPQARAYGLREAHDRLMRHAEREIVAIYPYFSDDRLIASMIEAKRRNPALSVKVLLPGVRQKGKQGLMYEVLNEESAMQLLKVGAEVRLFDGAGSDRFSHFKGLAIDGEILSLGSANADARTYKNNHELNTLISDTETARDFYRQVISPDWASARPVTRTELAQAGLTRRVARKVLEFFDFLL